MWQGGLTCEHEYVTPHRPTFYNMTATNQGTFPTPASLKMRYRMPVLKRASVRRDAFCLCSIHDLICAC